MNYPDNIWKQLKNLSVKDLMRSLERDGWIKDETKGSIYLYRHPDGRRVTIHFHPGKTYGPKMLKGILNDIGWTVSDFRRLKLTK